MSHLTATEALAFSDVREGLGTSDTGVVGYAFHVTHSYDIGVAEATI